MRNRTVIHKVSPVLNQGKYLIKRTPGGIVKVSADIFCDGDDLIKAAVFFKKEDEKKWREIPMEPKEGDRWESQFVVGPEGFYEYKIEAWVDHLATWYYRFLAKKQGEADFKTDLAIGAVLLQKAAGQAEKNLAAELRKWATAFAEASQYHENVAAVFSEEFGRLMENSKLRQFSTVFDQSLKVRVGRPKELFSTWYLMFPRSAGKDGKHGTFKDCERQLPRIAEMGFDVLFLPPIFPIGTINRKGKNNAIAAGQDDVGSPWSTGSKEGGHKSVNPLLGTMRDFERLVKAAGQKGIEIAMDMSLRCSVEHPYIEEHPNWFLRTPDGQLIVEEKPPLRYQDIVDFDFECDDWERLWLEIKSIVLFWAEKNVRIFYAGTAHFKPFLFWNWLIKEVQMEYPDIIFLSGAFTRNSVREELAKAGFNQLFTNFLWKNTNKKELQDFVLELTKGDTREFLHPNFFTNTPDILPNNLVDAAQERFLLQYALASTLSSNCGIYGPAFELMYNQRHPDSKERYLHSEKYQIGAHKWEEQNRIIDFITRMNRIRKENPALQHTFNIHFSNTDNESLISFIKITPDLKNAIWCVISLDPHNIQSGYVEVPKGVLGLKDRWMNLELTDLLTGEVYHWFNDWNYVELNPERYPLHVLAVKY